MKSILVLHGPNLQLLGRRQPTLYGHTSLQEINTNLKQVAKLQGFSVQAHQTDSESELLAHIHQAKINNIAYIILNAAAFTHTSLALRDALLAIELPFIEVHLSNIYARESFRQQSYLSDIAQGIICGLGPLGYELALKAVISSLTTQLDG